MARRGDEKQEGAQNEVWDSNLHYLGLWNQGCCICGLHMGCKSANYWPLSVIRKRAMHIEINCVTLDAFLVCLYTHTHAAKAFSVREGVGSFILMFWCKFLALMRTDTLSMWWANTEGSSGHMNESMWWWGSWWEDVMEWLNSLFKIISVAIEQRVEWEDSGEEWVRTSDLGKRWQWPEPRWWWYRISRIFSWIGGWAIKRILYS